MSGWSPMQAVLRQTCGAIAGLGWAILDAIRMVHRRPRLTLGEKENKVFTRGPETTQGGCDELARSRSAHGEMACMMTRARNTFRGSGALKHCPRNVVAAQP